MEDIEDIIEKLIPIYEKETGDTYHGIDDGNVDRYFVIWLLYKMPEIAPHYFT